MATSAALADVVPSRFAHLTPPDEVNIERIRADLESGSQMLLNVPHVFRRPEDGKYELLAGHDRVEAARRVGWTAVQIRDFTGTSEVMNDDAILAHFCKENLLRKDVSKAAVAAEWLRKHPDWMDTRIASMSGCSSEYVGEVRAEMVAVGAIQVPELRVAEDGSTRKSYKPRQVRHDVPSGRGIKHPTKTTEVKYESGQEMADALTKPKSAPGQEQPTGLASNPPVMVEGTASPGGGKDSQAPPLTREQQIEAARELMARDANPNARLPRRPPIARLMEFVRVAVDLEEPSADEVDAVPANDLMLEHLERAHRIIGLILTRNGRSVAA